MVCYACRTEKPHTAFAPAELCGDRFAPRCRACSSARPGSTSHNANVNAISKIAYSLAGSSTAFYQLPKEERVELRKRGAALYALDENNATSRPTVPRRSRIHSLPRLAREPKRVSRRRRISINRRADHGPGFLYAMFDPAIYESRREIKLGLTTNLDRRLGQAHNLGDFRYLAFVPVSDMKNAESWLMRTYANECVENERFCIRSFQEIRAMLSLAASTFKADRSLFLGLDSNHPEVIANG